MTVQEGGKETEYRRKGAKQKEMKYEKERDNRDLERDWLSEADRGGEREIERNRKKGKQREGDSTKNKKRKSEKE